jgi:glycerophosphoryl diester phosphodiesterase
LQKADGIEIDIRLTSDHHIVCHHDKSTLRTTGIEKVISETTLNELKKLDCGGWFGASWKN